MIAPKHKPVISAELTWRDVDRLPKTMKMALISTAACGYPSPDLPLSVNTIDCSTTAKRVSKQAGVPEIIDKIGNLIATIVVKFLIVTVFVQEKSGGERTV
jgi:hypothetical protein